MRIATLVARILLGLAYTVFGLMFFIVEPSPDQMPTGTALAFFQGLAATGYFLPFLKVLETLFGLLLLTGIWAPLAAIALVPITTHIVLYHAMLAPEGIAIALVMLMLHVFVIYAYRAKYQPMLTRG